MEYLLSILAFLKKDETFLAMLAGEEEQAEEIVAPSSAEEQGPGATSEVPGKDGSNGGYDNRYEVDMEVQSKDINEWIGDLARDLVRGLPAECEGKKMKAEY